MRRVGIADFKAHLSSYLREAREGAVIAVTDRGTAVAELRPVRNNGLRARPAKGSLRGFKPLPPLDLGGVDIVDVLLELRQNHR